MDHYLFRFPPKTQASVSSPDKCSAFLPHGINRGSITVNGTSGASSKGSVCFRWRSSFLGWRHRFTRLPFQLARGWPLRADRQDSCPIWGIHDSRHFFWPLDVEGFFRPVVGPQQKGANQSYCTNCAFLWIDARAAFSFVEDVVAARWRGNPDIPPDRHCSGPFPRLPAAQRSFISSVSGESVSDNRVL